MYKVVATLAWASLKRRKSRSLLVVLMIAVSLWGLLFMEGIYDGMTEQMIDNAIRSGSGHLTLSARGYRLNPDLYTLIEDIDEIESVLTADPRIVCFAKRLRQDGLIATARYSRGISIFGVNLAGEKEHGRLNEYLVEGIYGFGPKDKGAILGSRLAEKLKTGVGKKVILSAQDSTRQVGAVSLRITGIIKTNNMALDGSAVFISETRSRQLLEIPVAVSQVCLMVHKEEQIKDVQKDLQARFPVLEVFRWDEVYPALMQSRVIMERFNLLTSLLVFGVAGLGIFGIMLVSVLERLREFGVMLAIGTRFSQVCSVVLAESFLIGFSGYLAGAFLGGLTLVYFKVYGLDLTVFSQGLDVFGMDHVIYALVRPAYFITAFFAVSFATCCSVIVPLRVLKKSKPIEAVQSL